MSQHVAKNLRPRQGRWNAATQNRISMTTSIISGMKEVKMLGLQATVSTTVENLRQIELQMASKVRWLMVAYNASANALGMFAPVLTLTLFAIIAEMQGRQLDASTAFTTIALLSMITHPANMVMTLVPRVIASFSSFERIQSYLLEPLCRERPHNQPPGDSAGYASRETNRETNESLAIKIEHVSAGPLRDVSLAIRQGSLVILSGPTAAGKSCLALATLGEIPCQSGTVTLSSQCIGYCSQTPWLPNGSVREVIQGSVLNLPEEQKWYEEVIHLCCLEKDIQEFSAGDRTSVGPGGMNLSGGQRQRVVSEHPRTGGSC